MCMIAFYVYIFWYRKLNLMYLAMILDMSCMNIVRAVEGDDNAVRFPLEIQFPLAGRTSRDLTFDNMPELRI